MASSCLCARPTWSRGAASYYVVEWDAGRLSWADFRARVCGATDPAEADPGSIRGGALARWESLGLQEKPSVGENVLHASASPFEALAERLNWLGVALEQDSFGAALLAAGIPAETIREWSVDPQVAIDGEGRRGSLFDALEDIDSQEEIAKCMELWNWNKPAPRGGDGRSRSRSPRGPGQDTSAQGRFLTAGASKVLHRCPRCSRPMRSDAEVKAKYCDRCSGDR